MKALIFIIAILTATAADADEWTNIDTALQLTYTAVHCMDWAQTRNIARNPETWHEKNPILGSHPSIDKVDAYFAATLAAHTAISYLLPDPYRNIWQSVWITVEAGQVAQNYGIGIKARF